jgi:hypothetical protein
MFEFSLLLIFLGVTGLTYGLLSLPRSVPTPHDGADRSEVS